MKRVLVGLGAAAAGLALAAACGGAAQRQNGAPSDSGEATQGDCPEYEFPLAEPVYNAKRLRDLSPFTRALAGLDRQRAAELDGLVLEASIADLQALMSEGRVTSAELVAYYVDRIARYDVDQLNAVLELNPDALADATAVDAERARGEVRGPLHGIPILVKDNIFTAGEMHTTAGAYALRDWRPGRDAFLVRRLRAAGAVILGKTNLSEWANYMDPCLPNGFSTLGGQTRSPYGPFDPSGSSSGSAVATAANFAAAAIGSETQGSVIWPARDNSLVGLKPSRGLISGDGIIPLIDWMDVPGPFGRTVADVALLTTAMVGVDDADPVTAAAAALARTDFTAFATLDEARKVRVGVIVGDEADVDEALALREAELGRELTPAEAEDAARMAREAVDAHEIVDLLAGQGVPVVAIPFERGAMTAAPDLEQVIEYGFRDSFDRFMAGLGPDRPLSSLAEVARINAVDPANRAPYGYRFVAGSAASTITAEEYAALVAANRAEAIANLRALLVAYEVDVVTGPVGQSYAAAGFPALAVPNGRDETGQPVGIVFTGDFLSEPRLLAAGYAYEQATLRRVVPDLDAVSAALP